MSTKTQGMKSIGESMNILHKRFKPQRIVNLIQIKMFFRLLHHWTAASLTGLYTEQSKRKKPF